MPDRGYGYVIRGLEHCMDRNKTCEDCPYTDDPGCDDLKKDALALLTDRAADYVQWAKEIGVHTCATCEKASDNREDGTSACPIEAAYALPRDGFCHLWSDKK